jgi:hypothetical protein
MGLVLHQPERVAIPPLRAPSQFFLKILILIYFYNFFCLSSDICYNLISANIHRRFSSFFSFSFFFVEVENKNSFVFFAYHGVSSQFLYPMKLIANA